MFHMVIRLFQLMLIMVTKTVEIKPGTVADSISADIDLKNNPNVTVTITNQVTDDPWFTGEDIKDNNFDTAGTFPKRPAMLIYWIG